MQFVAVIVCFISGIIGGMIAGYLAAQFESPKPYFHDKSHMADCESGDEEEQPCIAEKEISRAEKKTSSDN